MTQDDSSNDVKTGKDVGGDSDSNASAEPPPGKPADVLPHGAILAAEVAKESCAIVEPQKREPKEECAKAISVKILREDSLSPFELQSLIVTWATLAVLGLTFLVFYRQLRESQTQTGIFRGQATQAANDAIVSHGETEKQIQITNDQFRVNQRPYIWLVPGTPFAPPQIIASGPYAGHLGVMYSFTNYGKSPGLEVTQDSHVAIGEGAWKEVKIYEIRDKHGSIVAPNEPMTNMAYSDEVASQPLLKSIAAGDVPIVVFGHIEYTDMVANPPIKYTSEFCVVSSQGINGSPESIEHGICKEHTHIN